MNCAMHAIAWNKVFVAMNEMAKRSEKEAPEATNTIMLLAAFAGEVAKAYSETARI